MCYSRSAYGEPSVGLLPSYIYGEEHFLNALKKPRGLKKIAE